MKKEIIYTVIVVAILVCVAFYAGTLVGSNDERSERTIDNTVYNYDSVNTLSDDMKYYIFIDGTDTSTIGSTVYENGTIKYDVRSRSDDSGETTYNVRCTTDAIGQIIFDRTIPIEYVVNIDDYRYAYYETTSGGNKEYVWEKTNVDKDGNVFSELLYADSEDDLSTAEIYRSHTSAYIIDRAEGGIYKFTTNFDGDSVDTLWFSKSTTLNKRQAYHPYLEEEMKPIENYLINDFEYPVFVNYGETTENIDGKVWDINECWDPETKIVIQFIKESQDGNLRYMETLISTTYDIPLGIYVGDYFTYRMTEATEGVETVTEYKQTVTSSNPDGYTAKVEKKGDDGSWIAIEGGIVEVKTPFHFFELVLPDMVRCSDIPALTVGSEEYRTADGWVVETTVFESTDDGIDYRWNVNNCIIFGCHSTDAQGNDVLIELLDTNYWDTKPNIP